MESYELFWLIFVFCFGACVGSLINVVVARLPLEKSILWPGSRCGSCYQPIRFLANIPIFSYLFLRGRCWTCGARFASRYLWVELFTAAAFATLFWFDIFQNGHDLAFIKHAKVEVFLGWVPWRCWVFFIWHATLVSFLIAASLCDFDGKIIPLPLTVTGTLIGLVGATLMPWPWPNQGLEAFTMPSDRPWIFREDMGHIERGVQSWPFWGPLPSWSPAGSWQLGLLTGLAGAAAGNLMMRSVKFLFEQGMGVEALGQGDADLMMMVGAFLGWQMVVVSFFFGTFAALFLYVPMFLFRRRKPIVTLGPGGIDESRYIPFGPGLAIGTVIAMLTWKFVGPQFQRFFFEWFTLIFAVVIMGGGMFIASLLLGRRTREPAAAT
jgi:leader peptidase (prepilin peptidase) / N-methyltransferase